MWIYLALILADFSTKTGIVAMFLWIAFIFCYIFLIIAIAEEEDNQYYISAKNSITKITKLVVVFAIVFSILYLILPNKNTYYVIAGLGVGNYAIKENSERVDKALKILDLKLDNEIKRLIDTQKEGAKK